MYLVVSCTFDILLIYLFFFVVIFFMNVFFFFFFNDTATTEIYTLHIVGSVRCVQETGINAEYMGYLKQILIQLQMENQLEKFNCEKELGLLYLPLNVAMKFQNIPPLVRLLRGMIWYTFWETLSRLILRQNYSVKMNKLQDRFLNLFNINIVFIQQTNNFSP
eukprot:TRINITY_DN31255_c0_g1_i1.p2 TRINITY_DN31255_c0_g1~~TRINITY_DN31255_c0_g1_i1.p2  ORF type:complete len:163 (-),score=27.67 TRINITY_DN31255_c0_g1_i1:323-811(-)